MSRVNGRLREAIAEARATAQICFSVRPGAPVVVSTLPRFSFRSRAYSGIASRRVSRVVMLISLRQATLISLGQGADFLGPGGAPSGTPHRLQSPHSGGFQSLLALLPVARAQLVR